MTPTGYSNAILSNSMLERREGSTYVASTSHIAKQEQARARAIGARASLVGGASEAMAKWCVHLGA